MAGCADELVYRAPSEFVPHVLWLLSDSSDHNVCPCKPCHRATGRQIPGSFVTRLEADIEKLDGGGQGPRAADTKSSRKSAGSKSMTTKKSKTASTNDAGSKTTPAAPTNPPARSTKQPTTAKSSTASKPSQSQSTMKTSLAQPGPTAVSTVPTPPATHPSWNNEPTLFRRGEMVWCQQLPPSAGWRIGVIREVRPEIPTHATPYVIIGLGHSSIEIPDMERQVQHLRPFLTFSVPAISNPLPKDRSFSQVDWAQILTNPQFSREMVGLEASKLAALEIDGSWSTFNLLSAGPKQAKNISIYGGAFLGAEMIRIGDPIRHKDKNRDAILQVAEISVVENINPSPGQQRYELGFRGVEYEPFVVPENGKIPHQPEGAIFKKDTAFRTLAAKAGGKKMKCVWQVCAPTSLPLTTVLNPDPVLSDPGRQPWTLRKLTLSFPQTKSLNSIWMEREVAGRSYATDELLHVTKGEAEVQKALQTGEFPEGESFLNSRMQAVGAMEYGRKLNRWATYSQAVNVARQQLRLGDDIFED